MFKKFNFKKECIHCVPDKNLIGKRVLCGDAYKEIIEQVQSNNWTSRRKLLVEIDESADICPFGTKDTGSGIDRVRYYTFVYYDPEWDEKNKETTYYCVLVKGINKFMFDCEKPSSHIYAKFTDKNLANNWCITHDKFAKIAEAWEDGKTIQVYSLLFNGKWIDCEYYEPCWNLDAEYRVKPDEPVEVETSEGKMYLANGAEIPKKRRMTNKELAYWLSTGKGQLRLRSGDISTYLIYTKDDSYASKGYMIRGWDEEEWHEPEVEVSV